MTPARVVVTGLGVVSSIGWSPDETWEAIRREERGFRPLTCLDSPVFRGTRVGEVSEDPAGRSGLHEGSRTDHLAMYAARQAFEDAGLDGLPEDALVDSGLVLGITTGGLTTTEVYLQGLLKTGVPEFELMRFHECATAGRTVADRLGLLGIQTSVSTACASAATAISTARDYIQAGEADIVLAGGVDSLSRLTVNGFNSLLIHDSDGCRPFDTHRKGMTLGEGAGILVLENEETARARGARIHAVLAGAGSSCDAYHATAPAPDGAGILQAMRRALDEAELAPGDVDYVNAHGTGTRENDAAEAAALRTLFGEAMPSVSSTKGYHGHTLAAAGAIEAIICILALNRGEVPANLGLDEADPELGISPVASTRAAELRVAMSNSVGFAGNNCVLVFGRPG